MVGTSFVVVDDAIPSIVVDGVNVEEDIVVVPRDEAVSWVEISVYGNVVVCKLSVERKQYLLVIIINSIFVTWQQVKKRVLLVWTFKYGHLSS